MPLSPSPKRLLEFAQEISAQAVPPKSPGQTEIMFRAAVGRAYYAAFLTGRDKFGITATSGVHKMVEDRIHSKDPLLGLEYANLKFLREIADYQFPPTDITKLDWEKNWVSAEDLSINLLREILTL